MENNRTEILREIEAELALIKERILAIDEKVEAFRQMLPEEEAVVEETVEESDFTDMEFDMSDLPGEPAPVVKEEVAVQAEIEPVEMDIAIDEIPGQAGNDEPEPVAAPEPEPVPEPEPEPEPVPVPEPVVEDLPEPAPIPEPAPKPAPAVPKADTERLPWRLDKPGMSVKNIRSGISLYDRALFIGTLFKEDYALYDKTIGDLNNLSSLDEAVDYLPERFPDWNLKSDIVYNFMMAIRKKLG